MLRYIRLSIIYRLFNAIVLAVGTPIILKQNGILYFSEFVTISLIIVSLPMLDAGISRKLIRDLNSNQINKIYQEILSYGFYSLLLIGAFTSIIIAISIPFISTITPFPKLMPLYNLLLASTVFISFLTLFFRPLLETHMSYNALGLTKLVGNFLIISGFIFSKKIEDGLVFMFLGRLVEAGSLIFLASYRLKILQLTKVNFLDILKYIFSSRHFMLMSFLPVALLHSEKLFVEMKFPLDSVYLYSISEILLKSTMITAAVSTVLYNFFTKSNFSEAEKIRVVRYTSLFTAILYILIFLFYFLNDEIIKKFLNIPNYENIEYILIVYWIVSLFTALTTPFIALKTSNHYEKEIVKFYALQLVIMIFLYYLTASFYIYLVIIALRPIIDSIYLIGLGRKND